MNNTINRLFSQGCEVVYEKDKQTHVSGHASSEELKIMMSIVKPQYFVPIHGEYKHMVRHSQLAQEVGISQRNIFLMVNGDILTFTKNQPPKKYGHVQAGAVIVDGNAAGSIKSEVLKERRDIAEDGVLVVSAAIDDRGNLLAPVAIETQGVFISDDTKGVFNELYAASEHAIQELVGKRANVDAIKKVIKTRVRDVLRKRNSSFAVVLPVVSVKHSNYYDYDSYYKPDVD